VELNELPSKAPGQASDALIKEFITAWKDEFDEELSEGQAQLQLHELVEFYCLVARALPPVSEDQ